MSAFLREYLEERYVPVPPSSCWLWLLSEGSHGYGQAGWKGRVTTAPRLSYIAYKGEIPAGSLVQHSCDNKWCVNPDHLSLGNDATNALDKQRKGRAAKVYTVEQIRAVKNELAAGTRLKLIAEKTGVAVTTVSDIKHKGRWGHV